MLGFVYFANMNIILALLLIALFIICLIGREVLMKILLPFYCIVIGIDMIVNPSGLSDIILLIAILMYGLYEVSKGEEDKKYIPKRRL